MGLLLKFRTVLSWIIGCILIPTYTIAIRFVVTDFPETTWLILIVIAGCIVIFTLIIYSIKPYLCSEKEVWWCDVL